MATLLLSVGISFIAGTPTGKLSVRVIQWQGFTSQVVETPEEERFQPIHAVAFFPDRCRFATMNNAGPMRIWDVKTGKELKRRIAVVTEVESAKELMRDAEVPRQPAKQASK